MVYQGGGARSGEAQFGHKKFQQPYLTQIKIVSPNFWDVGSWPILYVLHIFWMTKNGLELVEFELKNVVVQGMVDDCILWISIAPGVREKGESATSSKLAHIWHPCHVGELWGNRGSSFLSTHGYEARNRPALTGRAGALCDWGSRFPSLSKIYLIPAWTILKDISIS